MQGKPTKGIIIDVSKPAPLHAASHFHQTEPWQGDRLVIAVYTLQMEEALAASDARQLMALGFPLPLSTGDCAASPAPARFASLDPTATGVPLALEVFAGSARITQCCRQAGLRADAIDHKPHALSKVEPLLLDLTTPEGRRVLRSALAHPDLKAVWWAPPCGAASLKHLRLKPCFPVWEGCSLPVPVYPSTAVWGHRRVHPQRVYCVASGG